MSEEQRAPLQSPRQAVGCAIIGALFSIAFVALNAAQLFGVIGAGSDVPKADSVTMIVVFAAMAVFCAVRRY